MHDEDFGPEEYEEMGLEPVNSVTAVWADMVSLRKRQKGPPVIEPTAANAAVILTHDESTAGALVFDELQGRPVWARQLLVHGLSPIQPGVLQDQHAITVQAHLRRISGQTWGLETIHAAMASAADACRSNPVEEYLRSLQWDGTARLATWLQRYLGCPASEVPVGTWWLQQAAARALVPGCQADYALILEGEQGRQKSTAVMSLLPDPEWYCSLTVSLDDYPRAASSLRGHWIVELEEMAASRRRDNESQKSFISRRVDEYRPAYGRHEIRAPRRVCFFGTTNAGQYLHDPTGARRWWPTKCGTIDIAGLVAARDQLWAEAVVRHDAGERRWPALEESAELAAAADDRREADPWEETIAAYAKGREWVSTAELLGTAVSLDPSDRDPRHASRVAHCAAALGWTSCRQVRSGPRGWRVKQPELEPVKEPETEPTEWVDPGPQQGDLDYAYN